MFEAAARSEEKGLCVAAGTQRRHAFEYIETRKRIAGGAIGEIVSARGYWNQGAIWYRSPRPEWDEMTYMIRDWNNWAWLSGDHIVEQHIHQIDVIHWFLGKNPVTANGFGGRHRRPTGDQFDFFSVEYAHHDGVRFHSQARQINGCSSNVSEHLVGTRGSTNCEDLIYGPNGDVIWEYKGEQINEARQVAESTLTAIMGRVSAYSGEIVNREEFLNSSLRLGPTEYKWGGVSISEKMAIPGQPAGPPRDG
jgi:predicted dehydrogenase